MTKAPEWPPDPFFMPNLLDGMVKIPDEISWTHESQTAWGRVIAVKPNDDGSITAEVRFD